MNISDSYYVVDATAPSRAKRDVLKLCRTGKWQQVQQCVPRDPSFATMKLTMDNNGVTTILHLAMSGKSNAQGRAAVAKTILELAPVAASIANGQGTLPIHTIFQRNIKMDSQTREALVKALIVAYPESLLKAGGFGSRTPLHVSLTDYFSPGLIRFIVALAPRACFMRDRKGYLPIHVACGRHCSIEKLKILLDANPSSVHALTYQGESPLALARSKVTKTHPNTKLIKALEEQLNWWGGDNVYNELELMEEAVTPPRSSTANDVISPFVIPRASQLLVASKVPPGLIAEAVPHHAPDSAAQALLYLAKGAMPQAGVAHSPQPRVGSNAAPVKAVASDSVSDSIAISIQEGEPGIAAQATTHLDDNCLLPLPEEGVHADHHGEVEQYAEV